MKIQLVAIVSFALLIQGCAGVVAVGAGVAATTAVDRRTLGVQIDDKTTQQRIYSALRENKVLWGTSHIEVEVLNGEALLFGQAPDEQHRQQAVSIANGVTHVTRVINEIRLAQPLITEVIRKDSWITTQINTRLIAQKSIPPGRITVKTENGEVFLVGLVTQTEADQAVDVARNIEGVTKVIRMFKLISETQ